MGKDERKRWGKQTLLLFGLLFVAYVPVSVAGAFIFPDADWFWWVRLLLMLGFALLLFPIILRRFRDES